MKNGHILASLLTTVAAGCGTLDSAAPRAINPAEAVPYAAIQPTHPALLAWAERVSTRQAAMNRGSDLRETTWLFWRDGGPPSGGGGCAGSITTGPRLLPPPTGVPGAPASGIPGVGFGSTRGGC